MRVSKFSDMIPAVVTLAVFTGALVLFPGKGLFVYPVPAYIVFALCECMALLNVWALGKYYVLTDQGIEHKFLGIRYRTTQWDEIGDVMRSRHPQRTQGKEQVLVITRKGAKGPARGCPRRGQSCSIRSLCPAGSGETGLSSA